MAKKRQKWTHFEELYLLIERWYENSFFFSKTFLFIFISVFFIFKSWSLNFGITLQVGIAKPASDSNTNVNENSKQETTATAPRENTPATAQNQDYRIAYPQSRNTRNNQSLRAKLARCRCHQLGRGLTPWLYSHKCNRFDRNDCCRLCNRSSGDNRYSCVAIGVMDRWFYYSYFGPIDYYCRQNSGELVVYMNHWMKGCYILILLKYAFYTNIWFAISKTSMLDEDLMEILEKIIPFTQSS